MQIHLEVGASLVELVHERDARNVVLVGLTPDGLALRLDAVATVEYGNRAVQHAQAAFDFNREVDVTGRIDDIDAMLLGLVRAERGRPEAIDRGSGDGDAALLLLRHVVHRRGALVHLTNLVIDAGVIEDALGDGSLTGIDVRHDADIARAFECCIAAHGVFRSSSSRLGRHIDETPSSLRVSFFGNRYIGWKGFEVLR
jgi:hypothetical protein